MFQGWDNNTKWGNRSWNIWLIYSAFNVKWGPRILKIKWLIVCKGWFNQNIKHPRIYQVYCVKLKRNSKSLKNFNLRWKQNCKGCLKKILKLSSTSRHCHPPHSTVIHLTALSKQGTFPNCDLILLSIFKIVWYI